MNISVLLARINKFIINPTLTLLFAVAFIIFFWGLAQLIQHTGEGGEGLEKGKKNMLYGLIGLVIMFGVYGIINFALGTFGIETPEILQQ